MHTVKVHPSRFSLSAVFLLLGIVTAGWVIMVPLIRLKLGLDEAQLSKLIVCFGIGAIIAVPLSRKLLSIYPAATIIKAMGFFGMPSISVVAFLPNVYLLGAALIMLGICVATLDVAINANAVEVEAQINRPAMSSFHGFYSLGGLAGLGFGPVAAQWGMAGVAICAAVISLAGMFWVHANVLRVPLGEQEGSGLGRNSIFKDLSLPLIAMSLATLALFSLEGTVIDWSGVYAQKYLGADEVYYGLSFALFSAAMAISRFSGDYMREKFRGRHLVLIGCVLAAISFVLIAMATQLWHAAFGYVLLGLGFGNVVPILFVMVSRLPNIKPSNAIALAAGMGYVGLLAIPPSIGFAAREYGLPNVFLVLSLAALLTSSVVLTFPPKQEKDQENEA